MNKMSHYPFKNNFIQTRSNVKNSKKKLIKLHAQSVRMTMWVRVKERDKRNDLYSRLTSVGSQYPNDAWVSWSARNSRSKILEITLLILGSGLLIGETILSINKLQSTEFYCAFLFYQLLLDIEMNISIYDRLFTMSIKYRLAIDG